MPTTKVNGTELHYQLSPHEGDPLVLVHGSWGDHHGWDQVVPIFACSLRVLAYDRRGHSASERPASQGSLREDAADLAALIEQLDLAPAHIVGNSFGASIVLRLASERPELFRSLIVHEPPLLGLLTDPSARAVLQPLEERMGAVIDLLEAGQYENGARRFVDTVAMGPGTWEGLPEPVRQTFTFNAPTWLDESRDPEWNRVDVDRLAGFDRPALLTQGGRSEPFYALVLDEVARALPGATRRTYPEAGHIPHASHPEDYAEVVMSFIEAAS